MDLVEAVYGRRATRAFSPQPVPRAVLERLIDAAVQAPSAVNAQSWDFAVVACFGVRFDPTMGAEQ